IGQRDPDPLTAAFLRRPPPGALNQDPAHRLRGRGEKVPPPVPVFRLAAADQSQIRLVHERGRLQRVPPALGREPGRGKLAQLLVNQRQQLGRGPRVAPLDRIQHARHVRHARRIPAQSFANKNLTTVVSLFSVSWPSATPALRNFSPTQRTSQSHSLTVTLGPSTGECVCPDGLHCDPPLTSPAIHFSPAAP